MTTCDRSITHYKSTTCYRGITCYKNKNNYSAAAGMLILTPGSKAYECVILSYTCVRY
jgi:hypothetical protein